MSKTEKMKEVWNRQAAQRKQVVADRGQAYARKYRATVQGNGCKAHARQVQTAEERDAIADYLARNPVKRY